MKNMKKYLKIIQYKNRIIINNLIEKYIPDNVGTKIRNLKTLDISRNKSNFNLLICTNDVSVRTKKTDEYKNQSENKSG